MPLYAYKCECGAAFDRFLPLARYDEPQTCECGLVAVKQLSAPAVRGDYAGYNCPITGKWIEGRKAHEENLARHGCRVLETGEREQAIAARTRMDAQFEETLTETAAGIVANMPTAAREQLGRELEGELTVSVERRTA